MVLALRAIDRMPTLVIYSVFGKLYHYISIVFEILLLLIVIVIIIICLFVNEKLLLREDLQQHFVSNTTVK